MQPGEGQAAGELQDPAPLTNGPEALLHPEHAAALLRVEKLAKASGQSSRTETRAPPG